MRQEKCSADGRKILKTPKRKTAPHYECGKEWLSGAEDELVVGIPPVRRLRDVRVQLELNIVGVQVEHIRIAIAVGNCMRCHLYHCRPSLQICRRVPAVFYSGSKIHKHRIPSWFLFLKKTHTLCKKPWPSALSICANWKGFEKP